MILRLFFSRVAMIILFFVLLVVIARYSISQSLTCAPDCIGVNLMGRNLSKINLQGTSMVKANLSRADLSNADLRDIDFSGANMVAVNLRDANLNGATMIGANLSNADLRGTHISDTNLSGADLHGSNLTGVDLTEARLRGADLSKARLIDSNLTGTNLSGVTLIGADLTGADLTGANLSGVNLSDSNLSGVTLVNANLNGIFLNVANLTGANLSNAILAGGSLIGSQLASVDLSGSNLVGVKMIGANFQGADLRGADLSESKMFLGEIESTDWLLDPVMQNLNELQRSQILADAALAGVLFDEHTTWPAGKRILLSNMLGQEFVKYDKLAQEKLVQTQPQTQTLTQTQQSVLSDTLTTPTSIPVAKPRIAAPQEVSGPPFQAIGGKAPAQLTEALYARYQSAGYTGELTIVNNGTIAGIEQFCRQGTGDILMASRSLSEAEIADCAAIDRHVVELTIANDALAIVVNPVNNFLDDIASEKLGDLFTAENWSDIDPAWVATPILRFVPAQNIASFDFFVEVIFGRDPQPLLDAPNTVFHPENEPLVFDIATTSTAAGFFTYAYYQQNQDVLKLLAVDGIYPNTQTVEDGSYLLSRPLFLYADTATLQKNPQVAVFLQFYLLNVNEITQDVGFFSLQPSVLEQELETLSTVIAALPATPISTTAEITATPTVQQNTAQQSTPDADHEATEAQVAAQDEMTTTVLSEAPTATPMPTATLAPVQPARSTSTVTPTPSPTLSRTPTLIPTATPHASPTATKARSP